METIGVCGNCHTPKGPRGRPVVSKKFAGGFVIKTKPFDAVASNITPGKETRIGRWTDAQIIRAIREGVRSEGSIIGPPMPISLYPKLSDTDVKAIVAYLPTIRPVRNKVAKSVYRTPPPKSCGPPVG